MAMRELLTTGVERLHHQLARPLAAVQGFSVNLGKLDRPLALVQNLSANLSKGDAEEAMSCPSVVVEYIVPSSKGWAFRSWHRRVVRSAERFEGFVRADRHRPLVLQDGCLKWYTVLHFDQPHQLNQWLQSSDREALLIAGREIFKSYKFKSFETGMEGWFCDQSGEELSSLGPPAWKEILAVVLGLYPIIMVQGFVLERLGVFDSWDPASAMLANNLITTCIFTLVVMPRIVRWLNFWLRPAHRQAPMQIDVAGTVLTVLAMAVMVYVFSEIA